MCQSSCGGDCKGKKMKKMFLGAVLLVVGALFLLRNFNVLPNLQWGDVWPWVSVIAGLKMVLCCSKKCGDEKKEGGEMKEDGCCRAGK